MLLKPSSGLMLVILRSHVVNWTVPQGLKWPMVIDLAMSKVSRTHACAAVTTKLLRSLPEYSGVSAASLNT